VEPGSQPLKKAIEAVKFPQDDRVAKGIAISIALVPWQVALVAAEIRVNSKAQFCGGIIVGPRWILTAAHCVDEGTNANQVEILIGTDTLISGGRRVTIAPNGIRIHEKWKPPSHNFDIALIQTSKDLAGKAIESLPIAKGDLITGQMIMVSGWGRLAYTDSAGSPVLLAAEVPYVLSEN